MIRALMISLRGAARFAICAGILALASSLAAQTPLDLQLKKEVLGGGIFLFRAPSDLDRWTATNVVVIVNDQDVTVFDSNTRPVTARMVISTSRRQPASRRK